VLIGKVAGSAGLYAPISFLLASLVAGLTVFSFAEFASRIPKSAGEAVFVHAAFPTKILALAVGLCVMFSGLTSSAAISHGFVGYLHEFVVIPGWFAIALLIGALGVVAAWGITESVMIAVTATVIEIGGLLIAIWSGYENLGDLPARLPELFPPFDTVAWSGILAGSILAFYAFIGFEDMVNVAEEVKDVRRNLPRAIIITLIVTTVFYFALALVAVLSLPIEELAASKAPIALLIERKASGLSKTISVIAIVAILNGALIQIIMAARVLYGLSNQGWLPRALATVSPVTQTPLRATAIVSAIVLAFALWLPLIQLAEITSFLMLFVFTIVNLALWRVKRRDPAAPGIFVIPIWVPITGFFASAGIVALRLASLTTG
jgi:APA family basic amino acid/polyamine antiporter